MPDLKNILVLDIETISSKVEFNQLNDRLKKQWLHKAVFIRNDENLSPEELYFERAAIYAEFGRIICIAVGLFTRNINDELSLRIKAFSGDDEKKILIDFKDLIDNKLEKDKLILCAHNGKEFDYPYLSRRYLINQIEIPFALQLSGKKPWEVQHLDTMEMWKFGDRKNYTSLDLLATLFDIDSSKTDMEGSMVNREYYNEHNLDKIVEYCTQDVLVTANLYLKMNLLPAIDPKNVTKV